MNGGSLCGGDGEIRVVENSSDKMSAKLRSAQSLRCLC